MNTITFPGLGISVNPDPIACNLFGKDIYWYGIIIAVGFTLAVIYGLGRSKEFGLTHDNILDMLFAAVPSAIVCARLYYCAFYWEAYADNPITALYIWEGGLAIYGGVIGALLAVLVFCKIKRLPFGPLGDIGGLGLLIGQMIGRWGNFMNREAHGGECTGLLRMGIENRNGEVLYYHPTFLYESIWNLIGFVLLHLYSKRRKFDGEVFLLYVAWYGLGRVWIEGLRTDSLYLWGSNIRVSQLLAAVSAAAAIAGVVYVRCVKRPVTENLYVNKVAAAETVEEDA